MPQHGQIVETKAGATVGARRMPTKQIAPRKRRKRDNFTTRDKVAIALIHIPGLLPDYLREHGTTDEIIGAVQFDHIQAEALGGTSAPQNGRPLLNATGEHKAKSRIDNARAKRAAKINRAHAEFRARVLAQAAHTEFCARVLAKAGQEPERQEQARPRMRSRGFEKGHRPLRSRSNWKVRGANR